MLADELSPIVSFTIFRHGNRGGALQGEQKFWDNKFSDAGKAIKKFPYLCIPIHLSRLFV
jgi:hypothetical protein